MEREIGIKISLDEPKGIKRVMVSQNHCDFVRETREGKVFYVNEDNISCPLARFYLGLEKNINITSLAKTLVSWGDAKDVKTAEKYLEDALTLPYQEKNIIYFPLNKAPLQPDVAIKIGTAEEVMYWVREIACNTGGRIKGSVSGIGAACGECTVYPLITGNPNVSPGCCGSRPGAQLKEGELFLALPWDKYNLREPQDSTRLTQIKDLKNKSEPQDYHKIATRLLKSLFVGLKFFTQKVNLTRLRRASYLICGNLCQSVVTSAFFYLWYSVKSRENLCNLWLKGMKELKLNTKSCGNPRLPKLCGGQVFNSFNSINSWFLAVESRLNCE